MQRIALSVLALAVAGSAWAGPKEAVHDAFAKFLAAKSFRATVTDIKKGEPVSSMEYVAPNRYHLHPVKGPDTIIVGDDGWMNMNGRMIKMPVPVGKMIAQYRNEHVQRDLESGMAVTDAGSASVDGEPAHAYTYTVTEPAKADVKLWVSDRTSLPLQIESQGTFMGREATTRVRYSGFDDPSIAIAAPAE